MHLSASASGGFNLGPSALEAWQGNLRDRARNPGCFFFFFFFGCSTVLQYKSWSFDSFDISKPPKSFGFEV